MLTETLRTFYAYNAWANERIKDTAANLTVTQFRASNSEHSLSVRDTLVHITSVQQNWLARFQDQAPPIALEPQQFPDLASVHIVWQTVEADTQMFVRTLDDGKLAQIIHYVNDRGEPNAYPLWQMMLHQVNHATQHRSEIAMMLTESGHSPGWLDFLIYIDLLDTV